KEEVLADGLSPGREVAEVVEDVIRIRLAEAQRLGSRVEGRRDTELGTAAPYRVVVVHTVDADEVQPGRAFAVLGYVAVGPVALDVPSQGHGTKTQLPDGVVQFGDRLLGSVHGDDGHREHAIRIG